MSVDAEGMDLDVLQSNDWNLFRPSYVLVECWGAEIPYIDKSPIYHFLTGMNYQLIAKTVATLIFQGIKR